MRIAYHPNRDIISTDESAGELFAEVIKENFPGAKKVLDFRDRQWKSCYCT